MRLAGRVTVDGLIAPKTVRGYQPRRVARLRRFALVFAGLAFLTGLDFLTGPEPAARVGRERTLARDLAFAAAFFSARCTLRLSAVVRCFNQRALNPSSALARSAFALAVRLALSSRTFASAAAPIAAAFAIP